MLQAKAANAILNTTFEHVEIKHLPSLVEMLNSGVKIERSARELTADKNQPQTLTINIIPRNKPLGGEEV